MTILVIITRATADASLFMQQFPDAVLQNENDPDIHIWTIKNIEDQEASKIQNYSGVIGSHFITL